MPLLFLSLSLLNVFTIKYVHTYIFKGLYRDILELDTSETLLDFKCWFYMSIHTRLVHLLKHTCRCIVNKREAMPHFLLPAVLLHVLSWLVLDLAINCIFMTRENVTLNHLFVPLVTKRKRRLRWVPTTKYMLFKVYLIHALLVGNKMTLVLPVLPSCFLIMLVSKCTTASDLLHVCLCSSHLISHVFHVTYQERAKWSAWLSNGVAAAHGAPKAKAKGKAT